MIALIGEQPLPNFLPVLHFKPDNVVFIYTTRTQRIFENLKTVLEKQKLNVYGVETGPYDIETIANALNRGFEKLPGVTTEPLIFNLTGGTKTMCLAAYQIAAQLNGSVIYFQSEGGQSAVDWYSWQNHQLCHERREQLPEYLHLHDVLDLQLGPGKDIWEEKGATFQKDTHAHLFEEAIANALRAHEYEVMCGVKDKSNRVDIDVMIGYRNQVGIIEAKTSDKEKIGGLYGTKQLSTAMRYLGGTYIQQFLVINAQPEDDLQMMCEILRIPIICLPHYKRGPNSLSLSQEDTETLLAVVDKTMKVGSAKRS
jgi:hypothetical protein